MADNETRTLESEGIYLFDSEFTASSCGKAIRFVLEKNMLPKNERPANLTFIINSPGGSVAACFALIDTIRGSTIPVHTVGLGLIASAGVTLFMAGAKGHRVVTPNTAIMSHQFASGAFGKEHELLASQRHWSLVSERILRHYMLCTGLSEKKVKKLLLPPEDVYMTGEQAVEYGIADRVVLTY